MDDSIKLHLGCGPKRWAGFVNIDGRRDVGADLVSDVRSIPYPDDSVDEIHAIHLIEHFWRGDVDDILREWRRALKPGGLLALECPCLDKVAKWLVTARKMPGDAWLRYTLLALYGEYWHEGELRDAMAHHWCYCKAELCAVVEGAGFADVTVSEPIYHFASRDMRVTARKSA